MADIKTLDLCGQIDRFHSVDDQVFNQLNEISLPESELKYNYCPDCKIPMSLSHNDYYCNSCGCIKECIGDINKNHSDTINSTIRISTGSSKGRYYNVNGDYSVTQLKTIMVQLKSNRSAWNGKSIPQNILSAAAIEYNKIQKYVTEDDITDNGRIRGQKKIVRRGDIKDEMLAALIYFIAVNEKTPLKKIDIANFMHLPNGGFARGENTIRRLVSSKKLKLVIGEECAEDYTDRYLDGLNITDSKYRDFIIAVVDYSEKRKICMSSQLSSKVVGAIWVVIQCCKLGISAEKLEEASDNTKRNTFTKFYTAVMKNKNIFMVYFIKYGIPI